MIRTKTRMSLLVLTVFTVGSKITSFPLLFVFIFLQFTTIHSTSFHFLLFSYPSRHPLPTLKTLLISFTVTLPLQTQSRISSTPSFGFSSDPTLRHPSSLVSTGRYLRITRTVQVPFQSVRHTDVTLFVPSLGIYVPSLHRSLVWHIPVTFL